MLYNIGSDGSIEVAWRGTMSPYGVMLEEQGGVSQPLRFPGQFFDPESSLHYNWWRYYWPSRGQYISLEPLAAKWPSTVTNFYRYAHHSPESTIDPYGLEDLNACQRRCDSLFPDEICNTSPTTQRNCELMSKYCLGWCEQHPSADPWEDLPLDALADVKEVYDRVKQFRERCKKER